MYTILLVIRLVIFEAFLAEVFSTSTLAACNLDFPTAQMFIAVVALGLSYFSYLTLFLMCLPMCSMAFFAAIMDFLALATFFGCKSKFFTIGAFLTSDNWHKVHRQAEHRIFCAIEDLICVTKESIYTTARVNAD